ncbi:recombinase RecA [Desulfofundulus sp.]|uniref:recombinase RecA n=1 Tax=Desulfofundulus sp. TaxID=2282750 RepID=UPI003C709B38
MAVQKQPQTKESAFEKLLEEIEKKHGKNTLMRLGDNTKMNVEVIPTGILSIDLVTGVGGMPRGRIIELYGPESSGKTTVALHVIAEAQKQGGRAVFIDAEHALDPAYARKLGVDIADLYVAQPSYGEQALDLCDMIARSGTVDVIVVDSVAALTPKAEIDGNLEEAQVGLQARLMSKAMRLLAGDASKSRTIVIFINQLREKIGGNNYGGASETTPGGRALKFYASMRIEVRKHQTIKSGSDAIGSETLIKVTKNKVAPPFKSTVVTMIYGEGISRELDILELAVKYQIVKKSGTWYSYEGEQLGQGRENVRLLLKEKPELMEEISARVREAAARESGFELNVGESVPAESEETLSLGFEPYSGN